MQTFTKRAIDVTINWGKGDYGATPGPDILLTGHRVLAQVVYINGAQQATADLRIYGMTLNEINQCTGTNPNAYAVTGSRIRVSASTAKGSMAQIYDGQILRSFGEFNSQPEPCLLVSAQGAVIASAKPVAARSYSGSVDAATVCADIAKSMNLAFENSGVSVILDNPYFSGTDYTQLVACTDAANINFAVDRGVLAIWPKGGSRKAEVPIPVSPQTGMVGYPDIGSDRIFLRTLMNPDLALGRRMQVQSDLMPACGIFSIISVIHNVESELPGGAWFTEVQAVKEAMQ
ncbi:MAG: hypothetical protein EPN34_12390 [Burkholderiaceae bacterium]|nr:MAG: hypothetical protein EPN34_12390 [Burkholderiaceae bacterium]